MSSSLDSKVALVTGAGSGIGEATAIRLREEGCFVLGIDIHRDRLRHLEEYGIETFRADISNPLELNSAIDEAVAPHGRLDIMVANAGINGVWAPVEDLKFEEWKRTLNVNLDGAFLTAKKCIEWMKDCGGSMIFTASTNGISVNRPGRSAYCCSKASILTLSRTLALELAPYGIRSNVVCPGAIQTNINESLTIRGIEKKKSEVPLDRDGQPVDVANTILFLASDASRHMTGGYLNIDGGSFLT